jgi:eukaryotic-like serine/threonine-protein kinase
MPLTTGSRLGSYEISVAIGSGGMGEVYRARDAKLGRDVALKVLPETFARDAERLARFEREAKVLASLNHPNIAAIYGFENSNGADALVMELVEGPTLADRIKQGSIHVDEALRIARQICEALEYAHERGIVHRDLKPANVKVTSDDAVKILDFGLAKAIEGDPSSMDVNNSPTLTRMATQAGVLLGTAAYMSPEQAKAKPLDRRADIWAFGCVLYEMLTGKMAFRGETVTDTLAAVIKEEPDQSLLPAETPNRVRTLLQRCLQKDPKQRLRDIGEARIAIEDVLAGTAEPSTATHVPVAAGRKSRWAAWGIGGAGVALAAFFSPSYFREVPTPPTIRAEISAPSKLAFAFGEPDGAPLLAPDGTKLVFPAENADGKESLWIRPLDSLAPQQLPGTESAKFPFWSPDSLEIGFFQDGKLKRIDLAGGPPVVLCDAQDARGGAWSSEGVIVFAPHAINGTPLEQVPATGGQPSPVASPKGTGAGFSTRWPEFLPDGQHFTYLSGNLDQPGSPNLGVYVGKLRSNEVKFLAPADSEALYAPPGYLVFLRGDTLMAQEFDAGNQELKDSAVPIAQGVGSPRQYRLGLFSVSRTGLLIFGQTPGEGGGQLTWFDAAGKQSGTVGQAGVSFPRLSPDGKRLAYMAGSVARMNGDIWVADLERGIQTRFTFGPQINVAPVWSPDGSQIAYAGLAPGSGGFAIFVKNSSGAGDAQQIFYQPVTNSIPTDWTADGKYIIFRALGQNGRAGIWALPLSGDRKPFPYIRSQFNVDAGRVSPNGRWIAYASDESGTDEVYVSSFPYGGGKWQVSQGGGDEPEWGREGNTVYYHAPGGTIMKASVRETGSAIEIGNAERILQQPMSAVLSGVAYAVSPDEKRFLVDKSDQGAPEPLTLVTNWTATLKK